VPYINGQCSPQPSTNPSVSFDGSGNPDGWPAPATKVNQINSLSTFWKSSYDNTKTTVNQVMNSMRDTIFLYEVFAFYNLFYGNNSFIRNLTAEASSMNLPNLMTSQTYGGPSANYKTSQA
jgi:hypothetical protein